MKLLISIVNAHEAVEAVIGGTDILDIKNPLEGSLGANFPHVIQSIRNETSEGVPVSVAIGDAPYKPGTMALAALGAACCNVDYIKVGLYGTQTPEQGVDLVRAVCRAVRDKSPATRIIAAAYADGPANGAMAAADAPGVAAAAGADGCMIDTLGKSSSNLFTCMGDKALADFIGHCRDRHLISALAGSLKAEDIPRIAALGPDIAGFRGAACGGDRVKGKLTADQVARLKRLIR